MIAPRKLDEFDLDALAEQARRERAEAVYQWLVRPVIELVRRPAPAVLVAANVLKRASA